jgi:Icc-related predicted phosphoesterase
MEILPLDSSKLIGGRKMRILVIADIHGSKDARKNVANQVKEHVPNVVVVCGDITQFGPPEWATDFLNSIPLRTLAIPGNCDTKDLLEAIEESAAIPLHAERVELEGITFVGLGGSNRTPLDTPFELSDEEIYETLKEVMVKGAILVVHSPAKGHLDKTPVLDNLGSQALSWIINEFSPPLVISAHIHEARGVEKDGETTYVNPGPASEGYAAVIDINDEIKVELIKD